MAGLPYGFLNARFLSFSPQWHIQGIKSGFFKCSVWLIAFPAQWIDIFKIVTSLDIKVKDGWLPKLAF